MSASKVYLITGLSGSGKTTAARALEDADFFVVDNLPLALLPSCVDMARDGQRPLGRMAVVVDVRNRSFLSDFGHIVAEVRQRGHEVDVLFFTASDDNLRRRYSETRRRHPLADEGSVGEAITRERELLRGLRAAATHVFDSTGLSTAQLRERVMQTILGQSYVWPMAVRLESFGFRYGLPLNADLVFDVRFMPNPYYRDDLRPLTGLDPMVQNYVLEQPACQEFLLHFTAMIQFLLPQYRQEGKNYLTIAFGCTGGQHRSVTLVEAVRRLLPQEGVEITTRHRDVDKG